ncbi:MAG: hypothetical protein IBX41_05085 [Methanophagales archaeon]|nr:hypothetical protein [Methanophagales archaeon]
MSTIAEVLQREGIEEKETIRLAACIENDRREGIKKGLADAMERGRLRKKVEEGINYRDRRGDNRRD